MNKLIFILPVCEADLVRVHYTVDSIKRHCDDYKIVIVADGVRDPSSLPKGSNIKMNVPKAPTHGHWGKIWLNQMNAMSEAASKEDINGQTLYVKIDADAVVVKPGFYERLTSLIETRPNTGVIGQISYGSTGNYLSNKGHENYFKKSLGWRGLRDFVFSDFSPSLKENLKRFKAWLNFKKLIKANDFPERFPIGGCYVLTHSAVSFYTANRKAMESTIEYTPNLGEDVITGLIFGSKFNLLDDTMNNGSFAVGGIYDRTNKRFRANPLTIAKRGHHIIHPTKYGYFDQETTVDELELVNKLKELAQ